MPPVPLVVIDPGHGGTDPGATGHGLVEMELTLSISDRLVQALTRQWSVDVLLTRHDDATFVGLPERPQMANERSAAAFVSVHINAADDPSARGFETYRHSTATAASPSGSLQDGLHTSLVDALRPRGVRDRGQKTANFAVLRHSRVPAILGENLFITNADDAALLSQQATLDAIAAAYASGLARHLSLAPRQGTRARLEHIWFCCHPYPLNEDAEAAARAVEACHAVGVRSAQLATTPADIRDASYAARHGTLGRYVAVVVSNGTEAVLHPDARASLRDRDGRWFSTDRSDLWDCVDDDVGSAVEKLAWRLSTLADYERLDKRRLLGAYHASPRPVRVTGKPAITTAADIIHPPRATERHLVGALAHSEHGAYGDADVEFLARLYVETCIPVGLDPLMPFCQMLVETARLQSHWSQPPHHNLAGIGVTSPTVGVDFPNLAYAVRAHVGRLLAYAVPAGTETALQRLVIAEALSWRPLPDRFRGVAPTLHGLARSWATDPEYDEHIRDVANGILDAGPGTARVGEVPPTPEGSVAHRSRSG
jgi:N-acetylmuramoyl-L-alanine amidase